jgi:hypothetical protein
MNNMSIYGIKLGKQEMKHIGVLPVLNRLTSMSHPFNFERFT